MKQIFASSVLKQPIVGLHLQHVLPISEYCKLNSNIFRRPIWITFINEHAVRKSFSIIYWKPDYKGH